MLNEPDTRYFVRLRFSPFDILFVTRLMPPDESTSFAECGVVFRTFVFFVIFVLLVWCHLV